MAYLVLILFPVAMAASCFVLRKQTGLAITLAVATTLVQMTLALQLPLNLPTRLFGLTLTLDPLGQLFMICFLAFGALVVMASWQMPHGENFAPIALMLIGVCCTILLLLQEPFVVALLLVSAGLLAVLAIVDLPTGSPLLVERASLATAIKYLVVMVIAGVAMYIAFVLLNLYRPGDLSERASPIGLTFGLLVIGFGLRLAIVPFHSWLTDLAEDAAPMVSVLLIALVNTTSILFLIQSLQFFPVLVTEQSRGFDTLMLVGLVTALAAPLLGLAQQGFRRVAAYLLVYNAGVTVFGLATITPLGLAGAVFESFNQMLAALLIFLSVGLLERPDGRPPAVRRDLLWRWPIAGAGLLGGGLMLVGIPPFGGYVSKLLIYEAAARAHPAYLIALVVAGGLALLALVRLARERLFGAPEEQMIEEEPVLLGTTELDRPAARRLAPEPRFSAALTVTLLAICLAIGIAPQPLLTLITDALRDLTFVRAL